MGEAYLDPRHDLRYRYSGEIGTIDLPAAEGVLSLPAMCAATSRPRRSALQSLWPSAPDPGRGRLGRMSLMSHADVWRHSNEFSHSLQEFCMDCDPLKSFPYFRAKYKCIISVGSTLESADAIEFYAPRSGSTARGSSMSILTYSLGDGVAVIRVTPSEDRKRCHNPCGITATSPALIAIVWIPSSVTRCKVPDPSMICTSSSPSGCRSQPPFPANSLILLRHKLNEDPAHAVFSGKNSQCLNLSKTASLLGFCN